TTTSQHKSWRFAELHSGSDSSNRGSCRSRRRIRLRICAGTGSTFSLVRSTGHDHRGNLVCAERQVAQRRREQTTWIEYALRNQVSVAKLCCIGWIQVGPHSASRRIVGQPEIHTQTLLGEVTGFGPVGLRDLLVRHIGFVQYVSGGAIVLKCHVAREVVLLVGISQSQVPPLYEPEGNVSRLGIEPAAPLKCGRQSFDVQTE